MKPARPNPQIASTLRLLAAGYADTIRQFEKTLDLLCRELNLQEIRWTDIADHHSRPGDPESEDRPFADRRSLSIRWQGRDCFLGNTLLFRFFEKLSVRPNRYWSHDELLEDVWGGPRSNVSIRNVAKRLRDRLVRAQMETVAAAIDGSVRGHYALKLDRLK